MDGSQDQTQQTAPHPWIALFQQHMFAEFVHRDADEALTTMTDDPSVINVPVLTGGIGREGVREFYRRHFLPQTPPDFEMTVISQTADQERLVLEGVARFTHTTVMDSFLPGVAPTGRRVEMTIIAIIEFKDGRIAAERLYWDQGAVLAQVGLIDRTGLPLLGAESARRMVDPALPLKAWG